MANVSYPQFGKVRDITLPVPAASMTFDEYKAAFGIDLLVVELYDLILIKENDVAVPVLYVDKDNDVLYTADKAYSYASGFAEISGGSLIAKVIEDGTIENAKPIYCHPITVVCNDTGYLLRFTCLIFNNSETPIDRVGFKAFLDSLSSVQGNIMISGAFVISTDTIISSYARYDGSQYYLIGVNAATGAVVSHNGSFDTIYPNTTTFEDGVNKIN